MTAKPRIEKIGRRVATAGAPSLATLASIILLAAANDWDELVNNAVLSVLGPTIGAATAAVATIVAALLSGVLGYFGLSSRSAAHNVSLLLGLVVSVIPFVGLVQALVIVFGP